MAAFESITPCSELTGSAYDSAQRCLADQIIAAIIKEAQGTTHGNPEESPEPLAIEVAYAALTDTFDATSDQTIAGWFSAACQQANVQPPLLFV